MAVTHGHGNPNWTKDETILALNLLFKLNGANPSPNSKEVIQLSTTLNQLPIHSLQVRKNHFRNPASVAFKVLNLKSVATGKGLQNVSKMDKEVWNDFGDKPELVAQLTLEIIKDSVLFNESEELNNVVPDDETFSEGKIITETHKRKERNPKLRKTIIADRRQSNTLFCDICGIKPYFNNSIEDVSIFECHHIIPLSQYSGLSETKKEDIAFLCANCHKAIHKKIVEEKKWITPIQMRSYLLPK